MSDSPVNQESSNPLICRLVEKARQAADKSTRECAEALGISQKRYLQMESGQLIPSLPEVEILAYFFNFPLFELLSEEDHNFPPAHVDFGQMQQLVQLRQRILSATLQLTRSEKKIGLKDLSAQTGIPIAKIKRYELTAQPIPLNDLCAICKSLEISLNDLLDQSSFAAERQKWLEEITGYESLPLEIRNFVIDPANQVFINLAKRLKETGIENIESLAVGLQQLAERARE